MPKDEFHAWIEHNPLRVWRKENRVAIMDAASRLGVSMTIIQLWEKGVHIPSDENLTRLEALVGDRTVQDWSDWYNAKPQLAAAGRK